MYIIGFNGPPQCGKDTLARLLREKLDAEHPILPVIETSLSYPLRRIAYTMTGTEGRHLDGPDYEEFKTRKFDRLGGKSGRQILIDVSESFLKPVYGQDIMANLLIASLPSSKTHCVVLIRDSGFQCEIDPLINHVGPSKFLVCKVLREGYDSFLGDSRQWVRSPIPRMNTTILNNGSLEDLRNAAEILYWRFANEWELA